MVGATTPLWLSEYQRRDHALRTWLGQYDWSGNPETRLVRQVVAQSAAWFPQAPLVVDYEWEVVAGMANLGRGDLLLTDGSNTNVVVEVKQVDLERSGKTARRRRNRARTDVVDQAVRYATAAAALNPWARVEGWWFTEESERPERAPEHPPGVG